MFDVGINQLRDWLGSRRVHEPAVGWYPEVGDMIAVGCAVRPGVCCTVYVRSEVFEGETDPDYMIESFERRGFEIWRVVDDSEGLYGYRRCPSCGGWALDLSEYCGFTDDYICTLEALRQLRDAGEWPTPSSIRYDVMMYDVDAHVWRCVGHDHSYAVAREICRKCERMGHVAYLCESQAVRHG